MKTASQTRIVSPFKKLSRAMLAISLMMIGAAPAGAQSAYYNYVTGLNPAPVAYWPLQETTAPPAAFMEANLGSLGSIANLYYASITTSGTSPIRQVYPGAIVNEPSPAMLFAGSANAFGLVPTTDNRVSLPAGKAFTV
jgi:hypothetical protein